MNILILGCTVLQLEFVRHLIKKNWNVFIADKKVGHLKGFENVFPISITDKKRLCELAISHQIMGVLPMNDFSMEAASYVSKKLKLIGPDYKTSIVLTHKSAQKKIMQKKNIKTSNFFVVGNILDARRAFKSLSKPIILKPDFAGGGSRGVVLLTKNDDLEKEFQIVKEISLTKLVVIEEFIKGQEKSIEILSHSGKHTILAEGVEFSYPSYPTIAKEFHYKYPDLSEYEISTINSLLNAVGHKNGLCEIEYITDVNGEIHIVEVCGRGGGGHISHPICNLVSNVDAAHLAALTSVGKGIFFNQKKKFCVVWRFLSGNEGTLKGVRGLRQAKKLPGIVSIDLLKQKGDRIESLKSGLDRVGVILSKAKSIDEAKLVADKAEKMIKLEMV